MSVIAVVGAQWGDEGKGRVVDYLADDADLVIRYGGGNGGQREMHAAVCAECGGQALVPFLPRNDRPVYCSNCFDKVRDRA